MSRIVESLDRIKTSLFHRTDHSKSSVIDPLPTCFWVEITNCCNFQCTFCAYPYMTRKKTYMDYPSFKKVIDMLTDSGIVRKNPLVGLHMLGEPLLHPEIYRFIDYMNSRGLAADLVTNGLLLNEDVIDRLMSYNVARLTVSIQSPSRASYEEARVGAIKGWSEYIDTIKRSVVRYLQIANEKKIGGLLRLDVLFMTTFYYIPRMKGFRSWFEVRRVLDEWREIVEQVRTGNAIEFDVSHEADGISKFLICRLNDKVLNFSVREAGTWAGSLEAGRRLEPVTEGTCLLPNMQLIVLANGDVTVCCEDYDGQLVIGNVHRNPIADIWMGDRARNIRDGFSQNKVISRFCQNCHACRRITTTDVIEDNFFNFERWGADGRVFQWMRKRASSIICRQPGSARLSFSALTASPCSRDAPQPLFIRVEDGERQEFSMPQPYKWYSFEMDLPRTDARPYLVASFETDRVFVPSRSGASSDSRELGAAIALPFYQKK